jgi:hypothetical protein
MQTESEAPRLIRDMEQIFVPDYDATNMPPADKRAAYALEHIAFRRGRLEERIDCPSSEFLRQEHPDPRESLARPV